jgi:hypothetical protein
MIHVLLARGTYGQLHDPCPIGTLTNLPLFLDFILRIEQYLHSVHRKEAEVVGEWFTKPTSGAGFEFGSNGPKIRPRSPEADAAAAAAVHTLVKKFSQHHFERTGGEGTGRGEELG